MCKFFDKLFELMKNKIKIELDLQNAKLTESQINDIVWFEMEKFAESLFKEKYESAG